MDWKGVGFSLANLIHPRDELVGVKKDAGYKKSESLSRLQTASVIDHPMLTLALDLTFFRFQKILKELINHFVGFLVRGMFGAVGHADSILITEHSVDFNRMA